MNATIKAAVVACTAAVLLAGAASSEGATTAAPSPGDKAASSAVTFKAGEIGDTFEGGSLWRLHIRPGLYNATFHAVVTAQPNDQDATSTSVICGLVDLTNFGAQRTRVFMAASTVDLVDGPPAAVSASTTVRIGTEVKPGIVCFADNATLTLYQPIAASFTTLDHRSYGKVTAVPTGKRALAKLLGR